MFSKGEGRSLIWSIKLLLTQKSNRHLRSIPVGQIEAVNNELDRTLEHNIVQKVGILVIISWLPSTE